MKSTTAEAIARIREILDTSNSPFVLGQELVKVVNALEVADRALERIMSGLTTDQAKVEFYTKREAQEARAEIACVLSGEGK